MQETSKAFLDRYNVIQDATIHYIHHAAPRVSTPAEVCTTYPIHIDTS
jgi:hypothetical protein